MPCVRQVFWDKSNGKWKASCQVDGKNKYLGSFDDEVEAARAFDTATKDIAYYQREGKVNFPAEQDEEGGEQDAWSSQYFGVRLRRRTDADAHLSVVRCSLSLTNTRCACFALKRCGARS